MSVEGLDFEYVTVTGKLERTYEFFVSEYLKFCEEADIKPSKEDFKAYIREEMWDYMTDCAACDIELKFSQEIA